MNTFSPHHPFPPSFSPLPLEGADERSEAGLARAIVEMAFSPHHPFSFHIKKDAPRGVFCI